MPSKTKSSPTSVKATRRSKTTSKPKRATAGDQSLLFSQASYKLVNEIRFGAEGLHLRLVESESGKRYIQCWSGLSKQWNIMSRYDVDEQWAKWERTHANLYIKRFENKQSLGRDVQLGRSTDNAKRTTRRKASASGTKNRKQSNGKS
jgi:hypothetical protein